MKKIDDIIINKVESIKRCVAATRDNYFLDQENFTEDFIRQDAAILNIQRACEQAIDLSNHIVKLLKLGVPNEARDSFKLLCKNNIIDQNLAEEMGKMVGFRNLAIHEYQEIDIEIVKAIIEKKLDQLLKFGEIIISNNQLVTLQ